MMRFFVEEKQGDYFVLSKEVLQHIKVTRINNKEFICVFQERFYVTKLENNLARIIYEMDENHEFNNEVILAAAIIKTKRMEWLIQKAAELGVTKLIPVYSTNVDQKISQDFSKKIDRWNKIAIAACEQSFRNKAMIVDEPMHFNEVIELNILNKFIAHEKQDAKVNLSYPTSSLFLVGPEGGFTDIEVQKAQLKGFEIISLGKRILRAETSSIFILSKIIDE